MIAEALVKQHQELAQAADAVLAALPEGEVPDAATVKQLLLRLLGKLTVHLATEDEQVYPLLVRHTDAKVREVAARLQQEVGGLAHAVDAYKAKWPSARAIQLRPGEFARHTRLLLAALAQRTQRENAELFPLLENR